jgi:hypothetical protein
MHRIDRGARIRHNSRSCPSTFAAGGVPVTTEVLRRLVLLTGFLGWCPSWAERAYANLIYFNQLDRGCHFAAWHRSLR